MSTVDLAVTATTPEPGGRPLLRAFRSAPSGIAALIVLGIIAAIAIFAPPLLGAEADTLDSTGVPYQGVSWDHPFGTDQLGRDIFARVLVATRLSIGLALISAGIALVVGVALGVTPALLGPRGRAIMLRTIDTLLSFPGLLTAIFITTMIGVGTTAATLGVGIGLSFSIARVTSTLALAAGSRDYLAAARVLGVRGPRLLTRYLLPNIGEPLIIAISVCISVSIVNISALSFLGLGVQPPQIDWGRLLTEGVQAIFQTPAAALGPAAAIALSALAFGFAGEALARAMNPLLWTTAPRRNRRQRAAELAAAEPDEDDAAPGAAPSGKGTLEVRDLKVTMPGDVPLEIVKGVSFTIGKGEILGLVGESGSGKSMTALAIAQLAPFPGRVDGTVKLDGEELKELSPKKLERFLGTDLAVVFQDPLASMNPALTIGTQLTEGVRRHRKVDRKGAVSMAVERLTEVQIPAAKRQLKRYPHEFSGGMRQRAMIAMGLMNNPALLIADEPTTALDVTIQAQIMDLLHDVNRRHDMAVLFISHNLALVSQNCHRVLVMYAGRIVEELEAKHLTTDALHPYTRALLGAVPELDSAAEGAELASIPGEAPDIASPPVGCPFHPRCPLAKPICSEERPVLRRRPDGVRRVACHVANEDLPS